MFLKKHVIGISHLIADISYKPRAGYSLLYRQDTLIPEPKRKFLRLSPKQHTVSFWTCENGISIETLDYGNSPTGYQGQYDYQQNIATLKTQSLEKTKAFFEKVLGFESKDEVLSIRKSPFSKDEFSIHLLEEKVQVSYLDDNGFTCLGLFVRELPIFADYVKKQGLNEVSDVFEIELAQRSFNIVFLRGPMGEMVELIELRGDS